MFIAIYEDGETTTKPDMNSVFALPGKYHVFNCDNYSDFKGKVTFKIINKEKSAVEFRFGNLEITDIEKIRGFEIINPNFCFSIFDHSTGIVRKINSKTSNFINELSSIVRLVLYVSQFSSWEIYEKVNNVKDLESEITNLKAKNDALYKQIIELNAKINLLSK